MEFIDKARNMPFVLVFWLRYPDGSRHYQGDSLNTGRPGINAGKLRRKCLPSSGCWAVSWLIAGSESVLFSLFSLPLERKRPESAGPLTVARPRTLPTSLSAHSSHSLRNP